MALPDPLLVASLRAAGLLLAWAVALGVGAHRGALGQRGWGAALLGLGLWALDGLAGAALLLPGIADALPPAMVPWLDPARGALVLLGGGLLAVGAADLARAAQRQREDAAALREERARLDQLLQQRHQELRGAEEKLLTAVELQTRAEAAAEGSLDRWRSLVENAPSIILTVDKDRRIVFANRKPAWIPGRTAAGASAWELVPEASRDAFREVLRRAFELGQAGGGEWPLPGVGDAEPGWQAVRVGPIFRGTEVVGATVISTDITEWKRGEEARRAAEARDRQIRQLEELNTYKSQLLDTAAHELSNPLQPIRIQLGLLKLQGPEPLPPRAAKAIALVERNVQRLTVLVQDMRDLTRVQSGKLRLQPEPIDLQALVADAAASFDEPARLADVHLEARVGEPLVVQADPQRVMQVLFNLVSNAVKFTPPGGLVAIEAKAEGGEALLRVQDTGRGLSAEQVAKLFRPFSQVHAPGDVKEKGTGLGLFISQGIAQAHGGRIDVESEGPAMGSTFTLRLPLAGANADAARSREASAPNPPGRRS
jgi:PAS domain S-box-containing protein